MKDFSKYPKISLIYYVYYTFEHIIEDCFNPNAKSYGFIDNTEKDIFQSLYIVLTMIEINCGFLKHVNLDNFKNYENEIFSIYNEFKFKYKNDIFEITHNKVDIPFENELF